MRAMVLLETLAAAGVITSIAYYVAAAMAGIAFARRASAPPPALPKIAPKVAILKPLHGLGRHLVENLVSFFEISYPRVEYLFGVESYEDRAVEAPVALRAQYQYANVTMVIGEEPNCVNRKVAKLVGMAERAPKAEIFVLSDADISVERDYLRRLVGELMADEKIGLVTCAYRARPRGSFASRLEALFINTDFAPQAFLAAAIEPVRYALGATIAIKRAALESIGGFRALCDLLADDFHLGRMAADKGWKVELSSAVVTISCEEDRFEQFWSHQLRWARTYRTVRPISLATLMINGPFWGLILLFPTHFHLLGVGALIAVMAARIAMSAVMIRKVLKLPEQTRDAWYAPVKDLLMAGVWFASLLSNRVSWAGREFEILRGGAMRELKS
ncbi:MAG TPA: bacteriohopanetetrol glucosamine biosynthesis glycosyltransferase HpnI [Candidatus Binataceae bacterium]